LEYKESLNKTLNQIETNLKNKTLQKEKSDW
jgi:hypothetical protein